MTTLKLPTQFAPAERASDDELETQSRYFQNVPLLQYLLDAVPDIVLILNEQRQLVFANRALRDLQGVTGQPSGLRPGEALDCNHAFTSPGGCGTAEFCRTCGAVQAILSSLRGTDTIEECHITQRSGSALDLQVSTTPLLVNNQKFSIFAIKDISSEKRRQALERIFFHDILNTAGVVRGFAQLLQEATPGELDMVKTQLFRLSNKLIDEISAQRELATAENEQLLVRPTEISSVDLLHELAVFYKNHEVAQQRNIELDRHVQPIIFMSDEVLLRRVIGNMLKNALEAIHPGETVTLTCEAIGDRIEFRVHNPGLMSRRVQLQIFQRSFSTKGRDRGLGTYSMKLLTERYLHGEVSFTSSRREGTTFRARYPLVWDGAGDEWGIKEDHPSWQ